MRAARTYVDLIYEGVNISREIADDLISFTWNDNASGQSDDVQIDLKNNHGRWNAEWYPQKGDHIKASIIAESGGGERAQIYCGSFYIDELDFAGPPSTVSIKAQSVPQGNDVRTTVRRKAWEEVSLQEIAQDIAERAGLTLLYDVSESFFYDRVDQRESDLKFLGRICKEEGFALKVTGEQIVIFSEEDYDAKVPSDVITLGQSRLVSWSFSSKAYELVKEVSVKYYEPKQGKTISRTVEAKPTVNPYGSLTRAGFVVPGVNDGSQPATVLPAQEQRQANPLAGLERAGFSFQVDASEIGTTESINVRASSMGEAERKGKAAMRAKNKNEVTGTLNLQGSLHMIAGITIQLKGFGHFDADYFVEKTTHTVREGYTTSVDVRRVLEGY